MTRRTKTLIAPLLGVVAFGAAWFSTPADHIGARTQPLAAAGVAAIGWLLPSAHADGDPGPLPLRDCSDNELQSGLEKLIAHQGLGSAVKSDQLALAVVDITDPEYPRLAMLNGDKMLYAASLPKIAILLGAFVEIESGALKPEPALWNDMTRMIRHSDNHAATRVLERVGKQRLLEILQSPRFGLYDPAYNGGLWVGKAYAKAGAYRRDPLHNLSHGATVFQAARFYYLLESGQLVGPRLTQKMKEILSKPAINHKFVKGLSTRPGVKIHRKSGTWKQFHADSALVEFGDRKYIIVGLAENPSGGKWLTRLAAPLHDLAITPSSLPAPTS